MLPSDRRCALGARGRHAPGCLRRYGRRAARRRVGPWIPDAERAPNSRLLAVAARAALVALVEAAELERRVREALPGVEEWPSAFFFPFFRGMPTANAEG